jgi:putative DNA primase/helicase
MRPAAGRCKAGTANSSTISNVVQSGNNVSTALRAKLGPGKVSISGTLTVLPGAIFAYYAPHYRELGFSPVPKFESGLWPKKWSDYCGHAPSQDQIKRWGAIPNSNITLCCGYGGLVVIDADTDDKDILAAILKALPNCRIGRFGSKGFALLGRHLDPEVAVGKKRFRSIRRADPAVIEPMVEIKASGQNIMVPPSIHAKTGRPYIWINPETGMVGNERPALADLPIITDDDIARLREALAPWARKPREPKPRSGGKAASFNGNERRYEAYAQAGLKNAKEELARAKEGRPTLFFRLACGLGWAVKHEVISENDFCDAFHKACEDNGLTARDGRRAIDATLSSSLGKSENDPLPELPDRPLEKPASGKRQANGKGSGNGLDKEGAHHLAPERGEYVEYVEHVDPEDGPQPQPRDGGGDIEDDEGDATTGPGLSETALALRLADKYPGKLLYVTKWGKWLLYDGKRWRADRTGYGFSRAREICLDAAKEIVDNALKRAEALTSAKTVAGVDKLAKADQRLAAVPEQFDADLWALNTPGGTVDLRTGKMSPHRPGDFIMKMTGVAPDPDCPIPNWLSFLETVTGGDKELIGYLQRMIGYCLTGSTREHAIFFLWGPGGNGKTTLAEAIAGTMGDYHCVGYIETFTDADGKGHRGHPTDLAKLHGARLVTVTETEEGRYWSMSTIKSMTGGDKITARFIAKDFFDFTPRFKPVISGNHKPKLRSVDEATRRRMNLIPFTHKIQKADKDFPEKLKAEWPGILAWAIEGCLLWQHDGLKPPKAVTEMTEEYLQEEDNVAAWIAERLKSDIGPAGFELTAELYRDWTQWAAKRGIQPGTQPMLTRSLKDRYGFEDGKKKKQGQALYGYTFTPEVRAEREKEEKRGDYTRRQEQDERERNRRRQEDDVPF